MRVELLHPADQLVMFMNRIYHNGMTTTSGGNLSIRDENGDVWITPSGVDKGSLTRGDMIQVKPDGTVIGVNRPSVELPFHLAVYRARPDLNAVLHAHHPILIAFSLVRKLPDVSLIPNAAQICGPLRVAQYGLPGSELLGMRIAKEFEQGSNTVLLENHGIVCGAPSLFEAFMAFDIFACCGRIEINANRLGKDLLPTPPLDTTAVPSLESFEKIFFSSEERDARAALCRFVHRCCDQGLFTSTQGTYSVRLSDNSFLITPHRKDRKCLEPEDIVHIKEGRCEAGKIPSAAAALHAEFYQKHPDIHSVINAQPPCIMSFAVTGTDFDSRLIPESYMTLRDVKRLPYADIRIPTTDIVNSITRHAPVLMVDSQCVIITGSSILNAFDRLEVLEYSADAIISCKNIGEIVLIPQEEIEKINVAFHLD